MMLCRYKNVGVNAPLGIAIMTEIHAIYDVV